MRDFPDGRTYILTGPDVLTAIDRETADSFRGRRKDEANSPAAYPQSVTHLEKQS